MKTIKPNKKKIQRKNHNNAVTCSDGSDWERLVRERERELRRTEKSIAEGEERRR